MDIIYPTPQSSVADLLARFPQAAPVFLRHHMSCVGCSMSIFETLEDAAQIYNVNLDQFLRELSCVVEADPKEPANPDQTHPMEQLMTTPYTFFPTIADTIETIPTESIVSRTIYRDDHLKAIVFAFAPGQELSEHTASVPAIIQILEGDCLLTLGDDSYEARAGAWARMPANMKHSIVAHTPVKMLLLMLP